MRACAGAEHGGSWPPAGPCQSPAASNPRFLQYYMNLTTFNRPRRPAGGLGAKAGQAVAASPGYCGCRLHAFETAAAGTQCSLFAVCVAKHACRLCKPCSFLSVGRCRAPAIGPAAGPTRTGLGPLAASRWAAAAAAAAARMQHWAGSVAQGGAVNSISQLACHPLPLLSSSI